MANGTQHITLDQLHVLLVEPSTTQQRIITNHLNGFGVMAIDCMTTGHAALDALNPDLHDAPAGYDRHGAGAEHAHGCTFARHPIHVDLQ